MFVAVCFTLLALLLSLVLFILTKRPSSRVRNLVDKIPGPDTVPILGNSLQLKASGPEFYQQLLAYCKEYASESGILRVWLGYKLLAVVTKAHTAEILLKSSKHMKKSSDYDFLLPWLGTGLLTSSGAKWHSRRKLLTPSFHFKILEDFLQVFNEQSIVLQSRLEATIVGDKSGAFDITPYITLCTLDIICETAMGQNINAQNNADSSYVKAIYKITELLMKRMKSPWLWSNPIYYVLPEGRLHNRLLRTLHNFTNKVIAERMAEFSQRSESERATMISDDNEKPSAIGSRKRLAFLDLLLHTAQSANLEQEDIREEVDTFMFEGHDTTSVAANWAVHLIGSHPEVQAKLHAELDELFGESDRHVTMDDIKQLKYLECVIKEALRLFPSVPFIGREIQEDCNIGGYFVPQGASGVVMISAIHRDEQYFPDPEVFDPDRWLDSSSATERHPFAYIPFSAGPRNCIGQKFAMMEDKVILSSILRRFRITSLQTRDQVFPCGELILHSLNGIQVRIERRV